MQMAAILGISDKHLQRLAADLGMPKMGYGQYPLAACVQWYVKYWEDKAKGREASKIKQSGEEMDLRLKEIKVQEASGHLVARAPMVQLISAGFLRLGKWLDQLPTVLARKHGLSSEVQRSIRAHTDEGRVALVRDWREYLDPVVTEDAAKSSRQP